MQGQLPTSRQGRTGQTAQELSARYQPPFFTFGVGSEIQSFLAGVRFNEHRSRRSYCPSWLFMAASIFSLTAARLKEAGDCIGG